MFGLAPAESIRARIVALEGERDALSARGALAKRTAAELAFDAEEGGKARLERDQHQALAAECDRRLNEIDAALAGARQRLADIDAAEAEARKQSAAREAARLAELRTKAARRLDKALADAERAYIEYADLEPELAAQLRAASAARPEELRVLATRAARAVRFAAWAQAPSLSAALGGPRATVAHRRPLAEADRTLTPALPALEPAK